MLLLEDVLLYTWAPPVIPADVTPQCLSRFLSLTKAWIPPLLLANSLSHSADHMEAFKNSQVFALALETATPPGPLLNALRTAFASGRPSTAPYHRPDTPPPPPEGLKPARARSRSRGRQSSRGRGTASTAKGKERADPVPPLANKKIVHPFITRKKRSLPTDAIFRPEVVSDKRPTGAAVVSTFNLAAISLGTALCVKAFTWTRAGSVALTPMEPATADQFYFEDATTIRILQTILPGGKFLPAYFDTPHQVKIRNVPCRVDGELVHPDRIVEFITDDLALSKADVMPTSRWFVNKFTLALDTTLRADFLIVFLTPEAKKILPEPQGRHRRRVSLCGPILQAAQQEGRPVHSVLGARPLRWVL